MQENIAVILINFHQEILWLQISMINASGVKMVDNHDNVGKEMNDLVLLE